MEERKGRLEETITDEQRGRSSTDTCRPTLKTGKERRISFGFSVASGLNPLQTLIASSQYTGVHCYIAEETEETKRHCFMFLSNNQLNFTKSTRLRTVLCFRRCMLDLFRADSSRSPVGFSSALLFFISFVHRGDCILPSAKCQCCASSVHIFLFFHAPMGSDIYQSSSLLINESN